jgi:hexosaminidase
MKLPESGYMPDTEVGEDSDNQYEPNHFFYADEENTIYCIYNAFSEISITFKNTIMKRIFLTSFCFFTIIMINTIGGSPNQIALIPKPKSFQIEKATLKLNQVFRIFDNSLSGHDYTHFLNTGCLHGIDYKCINSSYERSEIIIKKSRGTEIKESYLLRIDPKGIEINASDYGGVLYAIETLKQILLQTWNEKEFNIPCMVIQDEPAFKFRGFMLDASRHYQPVAIVKHILDYMLSLKLNIFHWHLSDDQGWRVQSLKYPELNIYGSFMNSSNHLQTNGFYTLEEIHDIISYATERNIEIIPEFDIPGHSLAVLSVFPQLKCPHEPGSNAFCAGNPKTLGILKDIFGELIDVFKPRYIHIGGDERQKDLWNKCDLCLAKMKEVGVTNENDLQNKIQIEVSDFIRSKGVKTISWAENLEGGIAEGQIIQSWRLKDEAFKAIKQGHYVINSDNGECYIDYPENEEDAKSKPGWMPILPIEKVYNFNPVPQGLTKEEEKMVLGSECPLWTELITIDKINPQIKDRFEAHAEKCWTPKELKNYNDFISRLNILREYFKFQYYSEVP